MLVEKYTPKMLSEFLGNKDKINEVTSLIKKGKGVIILGKPGIGKTLAARLIAQELNYEAIEFHLSDAVFKEIKDIIIASVQQSFGKKKLIIIDEMELLNTAKFRDIIDLSVPMILISNEYSRHISYLKNYFSVIRFNKPRYDVIYKFLEDVCKKEKIIFDEEALMQLARSCDGDIRAALLDLE